MSIRSALPRRAGVAAGLLAITLSTGGAALASSHHGVTRNITPIEECASWTGTVTSFPALTSKPHKVTAVLQATLANCAFYGVPQTGTGAAFGVLTGTASRAKAVLSGELAVTWPSESGLNPTIVSLALVTRSHTRTLEGPVATGAFLGCYLGADYQVTSFAKTSGDTAETILGTTPFGVYEPVG